MGAHIICKESELRPGERKAVTLGARAIVVVRTAEGFHALRDACPHQGARLSAGSLAGTTEPGPVGEHNWCREGEILRCPWHGWEFDVTNGCSLFDPKKTRVKAYRVTVADGDVILHDE